MSNSISTRLLTPCIILLLLMLAACHNPSPCGGQGMAKVLYHIVHDRLGSVRQLIDASGNIVCEKDFDAWGNNRTLDSCTFANTVPFDRGFCGHEHLRGYINMRSAQRDALLAKNARLYDPFTGTFISPDPYIQSPDNSQNFNRYSYCLNNPLKYTDPSGESVIGFLTVAMMAYIGGLQANFGNVDGNPFNPGNWNWKSLRTYYGIVSGAFSGGQMAGYQWAAWTSKLDVPGIITNGSIHAAGEVAFNGICNAIDKRGFFEGWQYSAMFGFIDGAYGGYTAANENGENFWWGGTVREGKSPWSLNPNGPVVVRFKNVHSFQSIGQNDCVPQTLAEDYRAIYGKSEKTLSYFADDLGYDPKSGTPFSDGTFKNYFSDDMIHTVNNMELIFNEAFVREAAKRNNAINIYWKAEKGDMDHLDVVRKVKFYKNRSKYYVRNYLFNSNNHSYRSINNIFGSFKPVVIYRIGK